MVVTKDSSATQILLVDDDAPVRNVLAILLRRAGFQVCTAVHGFDALLQLKTKIPGILISDLEMPQMSGFELLSVVRRRFPQIAVVAMSGAYQSEHAIPGGAIADAFYAKGKSNIEDLMRIVKELAGTLDELPAKHQSKSAPVWIPRNGHDSHGIPYVVLTCTECLRSFPLNVVHEDLRKIKETPCIFCHNAVRYVIDFSLSVAAPRPEAKQELEGNIAEQAGMGPD
jgi:CheY-like chemotaxis protein